MEGSLKLLNQAMVVLQECLGLQRGQELLILWDGTVSPDLVEASRCAAAALGARPLLLTFEPASHRPMREYALFAAASLMESPPALPRGAMSALGSADVVLFATSDSSVFFNHEVREAVKRCKGAALNYLSTDAALRLLPESAEEVLAVATLTQKAGELLAVARRARVSSAMGTDLTLSFNRHASPVVQDGMARPGSRQILPAGQVSRVPEDGSAEGILVIDRSIAAPEHRELREPVTLTVRGGQVVSIDGGGEAARLRRFLEEKGDPGLYHVTELGIGTNRRCRFTGLAAPCEDTHTLGCVSLALGCDAHLGGSVAAAVHIDMTMWAASVDLDSRPVVAGGRILLDH